VRIRACRSGAELSLGSSRGGGSRVRAASVAAVALAVLLAGCSSDDAKEPRPRAVDTSSEQPTTDDSGPDLTPRLIAQGLAVPWGIAFLPDGSALIAQRDKATVLLLTPSGRLRDVGGVEGVTPTSEGGLLGLAVSPSYANDRTVYAYITTASDNRVVAMPFDGARLGAPTPVFTDIPRGEVHDGGRIAFGPDRKLYVTTGETGDSTLAQDRRSLGGKILRLNADGSVPRDNPFPGSPIWSYGHRNVQGIAWDAQGRLWASEFGSDYWDELNLIEPGHNYGWPIGEGAIDKPGYTDPVLQWHTDDASPSGIAFLGRDLWMAGLHGARLYRIPVRSDGTVGRPQAFFEGRYGRLRTVVATPSGTVWFTTSNRDGRADDGFPKPADDRLFEIRP
jgi:glucose/arabinose dehydrogenase